MKNLFNLVLSLSLSLSALAQAPQMLSYQAAVRNNSGIAIPNKKLGVRISIHESSTSGKTDYQETFTPTSNNLGLFTLNIGTGTPVLGTFSGIGWSTGSKFLQVEIDTAGGTNYTDMGTTQLLSVPYALYAAKAGNSLSAGNGIAIKNDSIVNISPDRNVTLHGKGTVSITGVYPDFNIHGDSAVAYKAGKGLSMNGDTINSVWTAKSTDIFNNNTGNVGIGKLPSYSLDIKGPANCDSLMMTGTTVLKTPGYQNLFIGQNAGLKNTTGWSDFFEGFDAGYSNTIGNYNQFMGLRAGYANTSGQFNLFCGYGAGLANTYGNGNVFLGPLTGIYNTSGNYNIFIGESTGTNNASGNNNVFLGGNAGYWNYKGNSNTGVGSLAGFTITKGNRNTFLGDSADALYNDLNNTTTIGYGARVKSSYTMAFGGSEITAWVFGRSSVSSTSYALQVGSTSSNGNGAYLTTGGAWTNASDRNKKENFTVLDGKDILNRIINMPITRWNYKGEKADNMHIGPMAQDFYKAFHTGADSLAISTIDPAGVALVGIQQLKKENDSLKKTDEALRLQNEKMAIQIEKLNKSNAILEAKTNTLASEVDEIKEMLKKKDSEQGKKTNDAFSEK